MCRIYIKENFAFRPEVFLIIFIDIFYYSPTTNSMHYTPEISQHWFLVFPILLSLRTEAICLWNQQMVHYCGLQNPSVKQVYPRLSWASRSDENEQLSQSIWCWRHCNFKKPKGGLAKELITKRVSQAFFFSFPLLNTTLAASICLAQRSLFPYRIYFLSIVYSFC